MLKAVPLAFALALAAAPAAAEDFAFAVAAPAFKVTIPNLPQLEMKPHPMAQTHPHLRFLGTRGAYTVAVMTPRAAAGMSALECASAILRTLGKRPNVPPAAEQYRAQLDERTFVVMYAAQLPELLQLNAHFLSAAAGTHCVEVHATKFAASPQEVDDWFKSFGGARIESR